MTRECTCHVSSADCITQRCITAQDKFLWTLLVADSKVISTHDVPMLAEPYAMVCVVLQNIDASGLTRFVVYISICQWQPLRLHDDASTTCQSHALNLMTLDIHGCSAGRFTATQSFTAEHMLKACHAIPSVMVPGKDVPPQGPAADCKLLQATYLKPVLQRCT